MKGRCGLFLAILIMTSCKNDVAPSQPTKTTEDYSGIAYTYSRRYKPNHVEVAEIYDTLAVSVKVMTKNDSIFFQPDTLHFISFYATKISDSIGRNHCYYIATYRPFEFFYFKNDSLFYSSRFQAPTGPDAGTTTFSGGRL